MSDVLTYPGAFADRPPIGRGMSASIALHALLLLAVLFAPRPPEPLPTMTEITMLDPGALDSPAAASLPAAAAQSSPGATAASHREERFRRETQTASLAPLPQNPTALDDQMNARLAAIQNQQLVPSAGTVVGAPSSMLTSTPAVAGGLGTGGHAPIALSRGGGGGGPAPSLGRGLTPGISSTLATGPAAAHESDAPAKSGEIEARRSLAGATLMGPIADRPILSHVAPVYPDWAKGEGVEGSVTLYFIVRPDGSVRENVLVQKTAGFEDFDENARAALRAWRFEALHDGRVGDQWGTITFHFRLRDSG
jgi:TonB family protein